MKIDIFQTNDPISSRLVATFGRDYFTPRELEMFDHSQNLGPVFVGTVDDVFVACWGFIPPSFLADNAYIWMWAPPVRLPITFMRFSRKVIAQSLKQYDRLYGHCALGGSAGRWLQWLGAEFGQPQNGLVPFEIKGALNG